MMSEGRTGTGGAWPQTPAPSGNSASLVHLPLGTPDSVDRCASEVTVRGKLLEVTPLIGVNPARKHCPQASPWACDFITAWDTGESGNRGVFAGVWRK